MFLEEVFRTKPTFLSKKYEEYDMNVSNAQALQVQAHGFLWGQWEPKITALAILKGETETPI